MNVFSENLETATPISSLKKLESACIQQINLLEPWKRGQKATPIKCLISFLGEVWPQIFLIFVLAYLPYPWQLPCKFTPSSSPALMGLKQDFFISFLKVMLGNPILFPFLYHEAKRFVVKAS